MAFSSRGIFRPAPISTMRSCANTYDTTRQNGSGTDAAAHLHYGSGSLCCPSAVRGALRRQRLYVPRTPRATMSTADTPSWGQIAENLTRAIGIAREAYKDTRRRRPRLSDSEIERIRMCELEIARYLRHAREAIGQSSSDLAAEEEASWRRIVLALFRAHSLVWEVLWYTYEDIPAMEDGSADMGRAQRATHRILSVKIDVKTFSKMPFSPCGSRG